MRAHWSTVWFTPTRVGKSEPSRVSSTCSSVHPHACGEISTIPSAPGNVFGSPPRVWGNLVDEGTAEACNAVHPHACGEITVHTTRSTHANGSPPRVWGNPCQHKRNQAAFLVHPHACGEILNCSFQTLKFFRFTPTRVGKSMEALVNDDLGYGSPPRVWGNLCEEAMINLCTRFTPTRVGKSSLSSASAWGNSVHPHACGEIRKVARKIDRNGGSPPRVWGNLLPQLPSSPSRRFTPTRVGKSGEGIGGTMSFTVHPHACGEICAGCISILRPVGSPPRVWGNLTPSFTCFDMTWFTPTRVGKSLHGPAFVV